MTLHKLGSLFTATLDALCHEACAPRATGLGHGICYKAMVSAPFYACTPTPIWVLTLSHGHASFPLTFHHMHRPIRDDTFPVAVLAGGNLPCLSRKTLANSGRGAAMCAVC